MSLSIPIGTISQCWSCFYWDWHIELCAGNARNWVNECHSAGEYEATDDKQNCLGYRKGE